MDSMQLKLRKALGTVKDQTSISIAKVGSAGLPDVEIAMVKATSHDETPLEEKYVQELLYLTSASREHIDACIASLAKRLRKTHNWIVAVKTLMLAHRLLRDGNPAIEHDLASARKRGTCVLNVYDFRDESHSSGWDFSAFVRAYGLYLDERLVCSIPSLSPPKSKKSPNNNQIHSHSSASPTASGSDEDRNHGKHHSSHRRKKPVKKMRPHELMQKFPLFQKLLERILACRPSGAAKTNRLVLFALHPIVRESFMIYSDIRDGMAILLDAFFDMEQHDCLGAFDIYSRAAKQVDELISFYSFCKSLGVCKTTEYPAVHKIPSDMLETMAASLRLRLDSARDGSKKHRTPQVRSVSFQDEVVGDSSYESNGIKSLPAPPYSASHTPIGSLSKASLPPKPSAKSVNSPTVNSSNGGGSLLDLDEKPATTSGEQESKLALALFSGTETRVNTTWERFSPYVAENGGTTSNGGQVMETNKGVTGWELALVESESDLSRPVSNSLAGGFDRLLLDSLYDQGIENWKLQAAASCPAGSASSVATPSFSQSNFLALSAAPAAGPEKKEVGEDPFAASINVPPPAYVQMAELRQKQQLLVQEQQHWLQYRQGSIYGYGGVPMNFTSNPFVTPFQPTPYPLPSYGVNSNYG